MRHAQQPTLKRLGFEELESRSLLAAGLSITPAGGLPIATLPPDVPGIFGPATLVSQPAALVTSGLGSSPSAVQPASVLNSGLFGPATPAAQAAAIMATAGNTAPGLSLISGPAAAVSFHSSSSNPNNPTTATAFDASSGNGQITLTTGANTLGISSFASSTNGFSDTIGAGS